MTRLRLLLAGWLVAVGERLATVTPPKPARIPQLGETLWLDGAPHTLYEFTQNGLGRARSIDGKIRHTFNRLELMYLEQYGWWTMKGREGQLPSPNAVQGA